LNWKEAFDIYIDNRHSTQSRTFHDASYVLWNHVQKIASAIASKYHIKVDADEMTSVFLCRLAKKRNEQFFKISGKSSYIGTALRNISIDLYRSELKHANPQTDTGRKKTFSLDQSLSEGRQLHEIIAAPLKEKDSLPNLDSLEKELEIQLYEVEIGQVEHRTPKGKQTFLVEAKQFRAYRDKLYDPKKSSYKKFDRQRELMKSYLELQWKQLFLVNQEAKNHVQKYAQNPQIYKLFDIVKLQSDAEKQERLLTYMMSLAALYQYNKSYGSQDQTYKALQINCLRHLFIHQMYRTKRNRRK
jgi:hypothetical protein